MKLVVLLLAVVAIIILLTTEVTQALKVDYFVKTGLETATPFLDSSGFGYLAGSKYSSPGNMFLKKLSASGTTIWEIPINEFRPSGLSIAEDSSHNIYIAGNGFERFITLKISPSGVVIWRKELQCQVCTVSSLAVVSGNLYVTGTFSGSFGLAPASQITGLGIYSARLSLADGNFISGAQHAIVGESRGPDRGSTNGNGQTCVIGNYDGTLKIGNLPSISGTRFFLLKTNSNGQPAYLKATGYTTDVSIDSAGRCYLVGNEFTRVDSSGGSTLVQTKFPPAQLIRCFTDKCFIAGVTADWMSLTSQQTYGIFDFPISQYTYTTFPFIAEISLEGYVRDAIFERSSSWVLLGQLSAISNQVMLVEGGSGTRQWDLKTLTSNNELLVSRFTQAPNVCQSCPSGQKCCHQNSGAYVCYDPNVRGCAEGVLCQENYLACGAHCYPKGQFTCTSGWGLCGKGFLKCSTGGVCYNPTTHKCIDQVLVCKINEVRCYRWNKCYDPTRSICCREGVVPIDPGCAPCC